MMTRKNNVAMRKFNDNIHHKNLAINTISLSRVMNTEHASKNIFTYIIWQLFELAYPMSSAIYDLFLYLQSEG